MKKVYALAFVFLFSPLVFACEMHDLLEVNNGFVRQTLPGKNVTAAFMELNNVEDHSRALIAVASPLAENVQVHETIHEEGVAKMRHVNRLEIAAGEAVNLQPGGLHVMLMGLKSELEAGQQVPFTLVFADGSTQQLMLPVE